MEGAPSGTFIMIIIFKAFLVVFLLIWIGAGVAMMVNYDKWFGLRRDEPWESPGARSLSFAHIGSIWLGFFALGVWFLFR